MNIERTAHNLDADDTLWAVQHGQFLIERQGERLDTASMPVACQYA